MRKYYGDVVPTRGMISIATVIEHVAFETNIERADLLGHCRKRPLAWARCSAAWLARRHTGKTMTQIGRALGNREHSTIAAAIQRASMLRLTDAYYREIIDRIDALLVEAALASVEPDDLKVAA